MRIPTKFILLQIIFSFFIVHDLYAQVGYEDIVYLKNGSIIHGMIIEQVPNQTLKIQTKDRNVFVYKMEEIEKIGKENTGVKKQYVETQEIKKNPYSGFSIAIEGCVGNGIGQKNKNQSMMGFHGLFGYMHNSKFFGGVGVGFNQWGANYFQSNPFIPVDFSFSIRSFPLRNRFSPMIIADLGYALEPDNTEVTGGLLINVGVGGRINFTQKRGLTMAVSYKAQRLEMSSYNNNNYYYNNANPTDVSTIVMQGICVTAGFSF